MPAPDPLDYSRYSYRELMEVYALLSRRIARANSSYFYALYSREIVKVAEELSKTGQGETKKHDA